MTQSHAKRFVLVLALIVCCAIGLGAQTALAQSSNVTGIWDFAANNTTGVLDIMQDSSNVISGMILGDVIEGRYIPSIRRLVFARLRNETPFQLYEAHVSANGQRLAGSFIAWNSRGGAGSAGVDFNFSATRRAGERFRLTVQKTGDGSGIVSSSPTGINCGPDCTKFYAGGTRVILMASSGPNSAFSQWGGDCSGFGNAQVTLTRNKTCTAEFEALSQD